MKVKHFLILLILLIFSCNRSSKVNVYSSDISESFIVKANTNQLSQDDYFKILEQLDGMFEIVYSKAQCANDQGVSIDSIRYYLSTDTEYIVISQQAVILDSVLNKYIKSSMAPRSLCNKYFQISSQAAKRGRQVGLY